MGREIKNLVAILEAEVYSPLMTTILSAHGLLEIPEEFRKADSLKPGQRCDIERLGQGEYRVRAINAPQPASSDRLKGFGCLRGKISMAVDFEEPLEDFKDYM